MTHARWLLTFLLVLVPGLVLANPAWRKRLSKEVTKLEKAVAALDEQKADPKLEIDVRLVRLDERVAAQETLRGMPVKRAKLDDESGRKDLNTLSAAIIQIQGRVKRIHTHDKPPVVTPREEKPEKKEAKEKAKPKTGDEAEWPEILPLSATSSMYWEEYGEWTYVIGYDGLRYRSDYHLQGYAGDIHFSVLLKGLKDEVKSVEFVILVTGGTGPFRINQPVVYPMTWKAKHRHMWNRAKKTWLKYDRWDQSVSRFRASGPKRGHLKPRVEAFATEVITKSGRRVTFQVPKRYQKLVFGS